MTVLDAVCKQYQKLFPSNFPEHTNLSALYDLDDKAEFHEAYFQHEYAKGQAMVERFAAIDTSWQGGSILDFGCGGGGLTLRFGEHASRAVGIDLDPKKIAFAESKRSELNAEHVEFLQYGGGAVPLPDASFDSIVCVDVVEHLPNIDFYFAEFRRLLKPDGHLLISYGPPWCHAHGKHMWHKLPGWWTHLVFPRAVVMRTAGYPSHTTYEDLGMYRLSVAKFERVIQQSKFRTEYSKFLVNKRLTPLVYLPFARELVISEVVKVLRP